LFPGTDLGQNYVWAITGINKPGATESWIVGSFGFAAHWDGTSATPHPLGASVDLRAAHQVGIDDLWAVGCSSSNACVRAHWTGTWSSTSLPTTVSNLGAVWVDTSGEGWAVGNGTPNGTVQGVVMHWTAQSPTPVVVGIAGTTALNGLWRGPSGEMWAVGSLNASGQTNGRVVYWPSGWSTSPTVIEVPLAQRLTAVWGSSSLDVWAVGDNNTTGAMVHWTGGPMSTPTLSSTGQRSSPFLLSGIWGSGPGDIWVVGKVGLSASGGIAMHFDGVSWSNTNTTQSFSNIPGVWGVPR
jgi:hypothetical protein